MKENDRNGQNLSNDQEKIQTGLETDVRRLC